MKLKTSEVRILAFLKEADFRLRYPTYISHKLGMDYGYTRRILQSLWLKKYVDRMVKINRVYYKINALGSERLNKEVNQK